MYNLDIITIVIIVGNVIISTKGFNDRLFFEKYKFNVGSIRRGEQIRMFSSGFLHADSKHLLFNMVTLFFFAHTVIRDLGNLNFITVYLASLVFGNLLSLYFHKEEFWYSAIGASGAVTGVLYSAILLEPDMRINFIPGYLFGIGYLLYSIYGMKNRVGNIGHDAHFGGAVGGYAVTLILKPSLFETDLLHVGLLAVPIIILFVLYKTGKLH
ncbi:MULTISPECIES: rhomboid family intramembrane serine protease [Winogradskyella]|uniref:Rhomboid family intramembrane serine protease n=1 Tax=Winogradskyella marincola TaxID=3037795 RepID=A0ABT6G595_9FLAO|nr:rhomboid family intramembrane serine protease [Winogradskyella sp. YYF002]MDG4717218.1 rhomboid family intramembrane serine protease [Winogradskyella sp. YYF002]